MKNKIYIWILFVILIWTIYWLYHSFVSLDKKINYYNISNTKYETLYSKRREDIFKIDYMTAIKNPDKYHIIDTREKEEFDVWHIPWTINIRVWDLIWDTDKIDEIIKMSKLYKILLLCHDWDRSIEIASFYKDIYNVDLWYIEWWIDSIKNNIRSFWWLNRKKDDTIWSWEFEVLFDYPNQFKILSKDEIKSDIVANISYDMANKYRDEWSGCIYNNNDEILKKSIYAPIRNLPTEELNDLLSYIWKKSVTTICYSQSTCFFSKIFWYRIDKQWWRFDGIYVLDWSNCIDKNQNFEKTRFRNSFAPYKIKDK